MWGLHGGRDRFASTRESWEGSQSQGGGSAEGRARGDRQEATKQQHKQEAGLLVTGWGPARAGKSPGAGVVGAVGELLGVKHPMLRREGSLQGIPSENDLAIKYPVMLPLSLSQKHNRKDQILPIFVSPSLCWGRVFLLPSSPLKHPSCN